MYRVPQAEILVLIILSPIFSPNCEWFLLPSLHPGTAFLVQPLCELDSETEEASVQDIECSLYFSSTQPLRYFSKSDIEMKPPVQQFTRENEKLDGRMWSESRSLVMDALRPGCGFVPDWNKGSQGANGTALISWLGGDTGSVPLDLKLMVA